MAGELVTLNWHLELRGLLHGPDTAYTVDRERGAYKGLGTPLPKSADVDRDGAAGAYGAGDLPGVRIITAAFLITAPNAAPGLQASTVMNALSAMCNAWASSDVEIPLYIRMAGWGRFFVSGYPRGVDEDVSLAELGIVRVLARFDALTPSITSA